MRDQAISKMLAKTKSRKSPSLILESGSHVAVIGGGPAGSFFSYFLLDMAERAGLKIHVDIYEPRDYKVPGPVGCNMCGGVIYESLVQSLAMEGINLPPTVVQRGIKYNMLHLDIGSVQIQTPRKEKRIATTYRGAGPRDGGACESCGLDNYLLQVAITKGAQHIPNRVDDVKWVSNINTIKSGDELIQIKAKGEEFQTYDFVAVASGVNTSLLKLFRDLDFGYQIPKTTKLLTREYQLGEDVVSKNIGSRFHGFLLDIPGLDYGAIIPKGKYVTVCLLSSQGNLETGMMDVFLNDPAVKRIFPPEFSTENRACQCAPRINVMGCKQPFGNRIVFIGDSGVSRLYKDGIGATYRAAKIAAATAVFQGISAEDFKIHYLPFCRKMDLDNRIGKLIFKAISQIQKMKFARRAILQMVSSEQQGKASAKQGMSLMMWDMLTGGALYREVLLRVLHPGFLVRFAWNNLVSIVSSNGNGQVTELPDVTPSNPMIDLEDIQGKEVNYMGIGTLGKLYYNGEVIVRQGEIGDCMYVVQEGTVEVVVESGNRQIVLSVLGKNQFFGEMAIFEHEIRTATVRALGTARILTIDHKNLLKRIHEDPSLAYRVMDVMSKRIKQLNDEVSQLNQTLLELSEKNIA